MKSLVLSAIICAATVGQSIAGTYTPIQSMNVNKEHVDDQESVTAFKQVISFHQRNVDVLWDQYEIASLRIKESSGNHAELERDRKFFTGVYQQDIDRGIRVEESKKAITEIASTYTKKHAERDAYEKGQEAILQTQLQEALKTEKKSFDKAKKKYASVVNDEILALLHDAEQSFTDAMKRADNFRPADSTLAAR